MRKGAAHMARSSSGSGRRPLKAEITSSNLVRATKNFTAPLGAFFIRRHEKMGTGTIFPWVQAPFSHGMYNALPLCLLAIE